MKRYTTASVLALTVMAGQAFADVTPQQVWDDFEAYMTGFGYSLSATESMVGSTLTVTDITMSFPIPEEEGALLEVLMPELSFVDNGDGTVSITQPAVSDITMRGVEDGEVMGEAVLTVTNSNLNLNVAGSPGDITYTYAADSVAMELTRVFAEGEEIGRDIVSFTMGMGPITGTSHIMTNDLTRSIVQDASMGAFTYDLNFQDPDNSENVAAFNGQFSGFATSSSTLLPVDIDYEDPMGMFKDGGAVDMSLSHTGGQNQFTVTERGEATQGAFSSGGGEFRFGLSEQELTYGLTASNQTVSVSGPEIPLPINAQLGELVLSLNMPLSPADAPQDASVEVVLGDFTMDDMLWNIFDPGQVLPREAATVRLDLGAKVSPAVSALDTDKMAEMMFTGGMPAEVSSVTLNQLVIDMVGGMITGQGAFDFDFSDFSTLPGVPRPEGELNLQVSGANGLIDNLIKMGLIGDAEAGQARMMMSMFAVPGDQPDTMNSKIEINEQGHILANGQRIQ